MSFHFQKYRPLAKTLCLIWLLALGAIHVYTLNLQPLPWYDETYMASLAVAFHHTKTLNRGIANDVGERPQELAYGPVFFLVCSQVFSITGFHMGVYRAIVFLSGCTLVWLTVCLFSLTGVSPLWQWAFAAILASDPYLFRTFHEGRMDLMAASLAMGAYFLLLTLPKSGSYGHAFSAGLLYVLALLTTPRIGFMLPVLLATILLISYAKGKWIPKMMLIGAFCLPLMLFYPYWIWVGFGGLGHFMDFYTEQALYFTRAGELPFFFNRIQLPVQMMAILAVTFGVIRWPLCKKWLWAFVLPVACFYAVVYDNGTYNTFIVPFYYLEIFSVAHAYWVPQSCKSSG